MIDNTYNNNKYICTKLNQTHNNNDESWWIMINYKYIDTKFLTISNYSIAQKMQNSHPATEAQFLNDRWLEIFGSAKSSERRSRKARRGMGNAEMRWE